MVTPNDSPWLSSHAHDE